MARNSPRKSFVEIAPSYLAGVAAIATATIAVLTFFNGRDEASDAAPADRSRALPADAAPVDQSPAMVPDATPGDQSRVMAPDTVRADSGQRAAPDMTTVNVPPVARHTTQVGPAEPRSSADGCRRIVGTWQWYTGEIPGVLTFGEDRQVGASVARGVAPVLHGSWSCDESSGAYTIRWQNNVIEHVTLADDGRAASGSNNLNMPIRGSAFPD